MTDEIKECIQEVAEHSGADIQIVEIGGTVGDMEVMVYVEAIRQMRWTCESLNDCCYIHVTLMPFIVTAGELKTKPIQNSVKVLRSMGIQPDVIICRTEKNMTTEAKDKVALFCNVKSSNVNTEPGIRRLLRASDGAGKARAGKDRFGRAASGGPQG